MDARLEAIAGPLKGTVLPLSGEEVSIGRSRSNLFPVLDPAVSTQHCVIKKQEQRFKIEDLNSRNGTVVNGMPVRERILEDGDQIRLGNSVFLFVLAGGEVPSSSCFVQLDQGELVPESTVFLRTQDSIYLNSTEVLKIPAPTGQILRDMDALLRISRAVGSIVGVEALERELLQLILEIAPVDRGVVLLIGNSPEEITSMFGWDRHSGQDRPVHVSRTIIDQVLREGVAMFSNDVSKNQAFSAAESPGEPQIKAVVAAPLEVFDKVRGLIYLDTADPAVRFDENLLQLLTAVGSIAAMALDNARRLEWLQSENRRLQAEINIEHDMVGESAQMRTVYQFISKVGPKDSTVLICGESGTGKELVARALHRNSRRAAKPFVAINCAALPETLLESELFGHEKGAFTGAVAQNKGKLEVADGGTLFLDEIGELAPALQAKLLRVLQEREFERIGGTRPIRVDIRLIAATNKDLEETVKKGAFRQDLYYRLNVVSLTMPPLRERREDIPLLATYFAEKYGAESKRAVGLSPEARACLMHYDWPGNVRELANAIERAVVLGSTEVILPEDLPEAVLENASPPGATAARYHEVVKETKKQLILNAVEEANGNYTEAAKLLGVHPNYLHRLIRNLNLRSAVEARAHRMGR